MSRIKIIGAAIITALLAALKILSLQKDVLKVEKKSEKQRADIAEQTTDASQRKDKAVSDISQTHQQETIDESKSLQNDDRDQLNNNW